MQKEELFKGIEGLVYEPRYRRRYEHGYTENLFDLLGKCGIAYVVVSNTIRSEDFPDYMGVVWEVYIMQGDYDCLGGRYKFWDDDDIDGLMVRECGVEDLSVLKGHIKTLRRVFSGPEGCVYEPYGQDFQVLFNLNKNQKKDGKTSNN